MGNKWFDNCPQGRHISVFLKITVLVELVLISTVVFTAVFVSSRFTQVIKEKEIALGNTKVERLDLYIREKYNRVYSLSNYIHSSNLSEILSNISADEKQAYEMENINAIQAFFSGVSSADPDISDVVLAPVNGMSYSHTGSSYAEVKPSYNFMNRKAVADFLQSDQNMVIFYDDPSAYCLKSREPVMSFMGKVYNVRHFPQRQVVGIYIMNVPISVIDAYLAPEEGQGKLQICLVNQEGQILYSTDNHYLGELFYPDAVEKKAYAGRREIGKTGLGIEYVLPEELLYYETHRLRGRIAMMLMMAICVTILIIFQIYRVYTKRIRVLMNHMVKLEHGDFESRLPITSRDEIGALSQAFNEMSARLNEYIQKVYEAELQQKNSEINALQMQISPHFLYNTLESIKAKALDEGDHVTTEMIALLGNLVRWASRTNEKFVIIEEELDYVRTYLKLQSYRYDSPLDIDIQADEENLNYAIPKLTLQPIVENVIRHGLTEVKKQGLAGIVVKKKASDIEITVYDNGCGMEPERLEEIRHRLEQDFSQDEFKSIGIQNVHHRLKLLFGKGYGMQLTSIRGQGTAVKVIIPALDIEEMMKCVQAADCR